jgi:hypothetical protein
MLGAFDCRCGRSAFGSQVVHASVQDYLREGDERYAGMYLDLCGTWEAQLRPALEALFARPDALPPPGAPPFVLGVTWGTRNPYGQTEDAAAAALQSLLMRHARVTLLDASECEGMRTSFYELLACSP